MDLPILDISHKRDNRICGLWGHAFFTKHNVFEVRPYCSILSDFIPFYRVVSLMKYLTESLAQPGKQPLSPSSYSDEETEAQRGGDLPRPPARQPPRSRAGRLGAGCLPRPPAHIEGDSRGITNLGRFQESGNVLALAGLWKLSRFPQWNSRLLFPHI